MSSSSSGRIERLVHRVIAARSVLLVSSILLIAGAIPLAQRLEFDQSIESLYAADDPVLNDFLASKRWFGGDEFVIVAFQLENLFEPEDVKLTESAARTIHDLAVELNAVAGVNPESTQQLDQAVRFPYRRAQVVELLEGILVGADRHTTALVLRLLPESDSPVPRGETIRQIRNVTAQRDFPIFVVGEPVQIHDMFRYVEEDGNKLFLWSVVSLALVLFVFFRNLRWVLAAVSVVLITIVWTQAVLVISGVRLSMVSSMLNSLVTIIGVATVTHITVRYQNYRRTLDRLPAFTQSMVELLPAVFWTCATTAVGFAALLSSSITPVQSFGLMMTLATFLVLTTVVIVMPAAALIGRKMADPVALTDESRLQKLLDLISGVIDRRPRFLLSLMGAVSLFCGVGFLKLGVETDFSRNFRADSPIVTSLKFVEENLGGAGTWEVNFPAPSELNEPYLDKVARLTSSLKQLQGAGPEKLTKIVSLTDGLALLETEIKLPFGRSIPVSLERRLGLLRTLQSEFVTSLYNPAAERMRIVLRAEEQQPAETKNRLIAEADRLARAEFPDAEIKPTATGIYVLLAFLIDSLLSDQLVSFALAASGILLMMTIAFRDWRIGLISLIPNLFPIVLVIGAMGWIGLPINIATAMIASVSMGLTIDNSIHYLTAYRNARQHSLSVAASLAVAHQTVGRALVFANLALICGFSVLTLSHFIPMVYFGILVSVAMLGGLVGNLVLLPLLLRWLDHREPAGSEQPSTV